MKSGRRHAAAVFALLAAMVAWAAPLLAQDGRGGMPARRDEVFRMIDAYLAMNVEETLGLSDQQYAKVLPLVRHLQSDRRLFADRRFETLRELREKLQSGSATEPQVSQLLKSLRAVEVEEPDAIRRDHDAIDQQLSVVQQAKYRVLEVEVERKIRALVQRGGMGGGGMGGRGGGAGNGARPQRPGGLQSPPE